jgi:hypothetical protein
LRFSGTRTGAHRGHQGQRRGRAHRDIRRGKQQSTPGSAALDDQERVPILVAEPEHGCDGASHAHDLRIRVDTADPLVRVVGVDVVRGAFGGERVRERPLRRRDRSRMAVILRRPKDGKAATSRLGSCADLTPLPGGRQHPDGSKQVGALGLYQRPLRVPRVTQSGAATQADVLSQFQQTATAARVRRPDGQPVRQVTSNEPM